MTILLAFLGALPCGAEPALAPRTPASRPPTPRVERCLTALQVVRDLDRDGVRDLCLRVRTNERAELAAYSAAQGRWLWFAGEPAGVRDWTSQPFPGALAPLGDHDGDGVGEIASLWRASEASGETLGMMLALHSGADGHVLRAIDLSRGSGTPIASALAATGDLDGDLLPDLLVLAPARELFGGWIAAISSANGATLWSTPTSAIGEETGSAIVSPRDVDGDEKVDALIVVADGLDILSGADGHVVKHITSAAIDRPRRALAVAEAGESFTMDARPHWTACGSVVVVGDLDNDAVLDVLVPQRELYGHDTAGALVSLGRGQLLLRRALPVWSPELHATTFQGAGDLDGDGRVDVLCADPYWNLPNFERHGGVDVGAVRILAGRDGSEVRAWHGGLTLARLGKFATMAGDVDRDGANDVWMSAMDTGSRPHEVLGLASGKTGEFLRWIDLGRLESEGQP